MEEPIRLPLANPPANRDGTNDKDARLVNVYAEQLSEQDVAVIKRPGLSLYGTIVAGTAQGMASWKDSLFPVLSNTLYRDPDGSNSASSGSGWTQATAAASWSIRSGAGAVVHNGLMWIMGGQEFAGTYKNDVWYSSDGATWTQATAAASWSARRDFCVLSYGAYMWVFAGNASGTQKNDVWRSTDGATWTQVTTSATWDARDQAGCCVFDGLMWIIAGFRPAGGGNPTNQCYSTGDGVTWSQRAVTTFTARKTPGVAVLNGYMWVYAGNLNAGDEDDVWRSSDGITWTQQTASDVILGPRSAFAALAYNNRLWAISGTHGTYDDDVVNSVVGITWTNITSDAPWLPRASLCGLVYAGKMWVMAGFNGSTSFNDVYYSNLDTTAGLSYPVSTAVGYLPVDFVSTGCPEDPNSRLIVKSTIAAYTYDGFSLTQITDADYPAETVPGVAFMDGYVFVMTELGKIHNSDVDAPTSWNALGFITANADSDCGVAIARQLNYIVALKQWSTEFFYNAAGAAPGSPLLPVESAFMKIGCAHAGSVVSTENTLFWMSQTEQRGRSVVQLTGYQPTIISTPAIDRLLNADDLTEVYAYSIRLDGHVFYILTLVDTGITLVYDMTSTMWYEWTTKTAGTALTLTSLTQSGGVATAVKTAHGISDGDPATVAGATPSGYNGTHNVTRIDADTFTFPVSAALASPATGTITATPFTETYFKPAYYVHHAGKDLVFHETNGKIYEFDPAVTEDDSVHIDVQVRTPKADAGSKRTKFLSRLEAVADKVSGDLLARYSDDDYTTFSKYRTIDLSKKRPRLTRLGSFSRRAFDFRHTDSTKLRIEAIELDVTQGET